MSTGRSPATFGRSARPRSRRGTTSTKVIIADHRRSSSAWAKYADALRRISLAWRSSRTSRSSALIRSRSSLVGPGRSPDRARLPNPAPQRLRRAADLGRDRANRRPLRCVLRAVLEHHPNRAFTNLGENLVDRLLIRHSSSLSRVWSLRQSRGGSLSNFGRISSMICRERSSRRSGLDFRHCMSTTIASHTALPSPLHFRKAECGINWYLCPLALGQAASPTRHARRAKLRAWLTPSSPPIRGCTKHTTLMSPVKRWARD